MDNPIHKIIALHHVSASAPCRVDMGGTLDLGTFYLPLQPVAPATFNMALDLRTTVSLETHTGPSVRISSRGFEPAEFIAEEAPFNHPMGLFFAVAVHFNLRGISIHIESASPPRSALGGSSVAAVALIGALGECRRIAGGKTLSVDQVVRRAHLIEESAAGRPCGMQDQLAAAFGGINAWYWEVLDDGLGVRRQALASDAKAEALAEHFLVAYGGRPHISHDVNAMWVQRFLAGRDRARWTRIVDGVKQFCAAVDRGDWSAAGDAMNAETAIRREMNPDVLDPLGLALVDVAIAQGCGGRFTGAGGGGCIWAIGEKEAIRMLRPKWQALLDRHPEAVLLDARPAMEGLRVQVTPR
ncbi:MAG: galactokinase [Desulfosarcina sp.]|nr:galactokinase [Desulfobacterales bacterium]